MVGCKFNVIDLPRDCFLGDGEAEKSETAAFINKTSAYDCWFINAVDSSEAEDTSMQLMPEKTG